MDFKGPETADFANVRSLNRAFLSLLRDSTSGRTLRQQLPATVQELIRALTDLQIRRLAAAPFMLMSLREQDTDFWREIAGEPENIDLLTTEPADLDTAQLAVATVAFLWQLARRNSYAARLISGATLEWCEQLASRTLLRLLQRTISSEGMLQPRLAANIDFWNKLLGAGLSSEPDIRSAAHLAALQTLLTNDPVSHYRPERAAACSSQAPSLRVADKQQF